jgi:hypothetical protein
LEVKKEPIALRSWPLRSSRPPPSPGSPTLLPMKVRLRAAVGQRVQQMHRVAGHAEAAGHQHGALRRQRGSFFDGDLWYSLH